MGGMHAGTATASVVISNRTAAAVAGGLVGGVAFGVLMQITGIVFMVAALVNRETAYVGWGVHMLISLLFALVFGLLLGSLIENLVEAVGFGLVYGVVWWILGGLIIMPTWLGAPEMVLRFTATAWQSLAGHLLYGLLLGVAYITVQARLQRRPARARM